MRELQDVAIGDKKYSIIAMPVDESLPVFVRLVKLMGAALGKSLGGGGIEKAMELDLDDLDLGGAVMILAERIDERETLDTIKVLLDGRYVTFKGPKKDDGGVVDMQHFAGDYGQMFKVLTKVLEVNFGSFLSGFKQAFVKVIAKAATSKKAKGA